MAALALVWNNHCGYCRVSDNHRCVDVVNTILIGLGVVGILVFIAIQFGKSKEKGKQATKSAKVSKRMTQAVVDSPKNKASLMRKIKKKGL